MINGTNELLQKRRGGGAQCINLIVIFLFPLKIKFCCWSWTESERQNKCAKNWNTQKPCLIGQLHKFYWIYIINGNRERWQKFGSAKASKSPKLFHFVFNLSSKLKHATLGTLRNYYLDNFNGISQWIWLLFGLQK